MNFNVCRFVGGPRHDWHYMITDSVNRMPFPDGSVYDRSGPAEFTVQAPVPPAEPEPPREETWRDRQDRLGRML